MLLFLVAVLYVAVVEAQDQPGNQPPEGVPADGAPPAEDLPTPSPLPPPPPPAPTPPAPRNVSLNSTSPKNSTNSTNSTNGTNPLEKNTTNENNTASGSGRSLPGEDYAGVVLTAALVSAAYNLGM
jgi:hypothetical protein